MAGLADLKEEQIYILPFILARYRFTLTARDPINLPAFKGSTLRGGFGHAFKRMICFQPEVKSCADCLLRYTCPYSYIFETPVPPDAEVLSKNTRAPRPLIIQPPLDRRTDYAAGEQLVFHITLIGRALDYVAYFLVAFQELGRQGLGRDRGRFELAEVQALGPFGGTSNQVYHRAEPTHIRVSTLPADGATITAHAAALPTDRLTLDFLTPTRLKHQGRIVEEGPPFHVLVRRLLDRVSSLAYFHCGERWEIDFRGWIERAENVRLVDPAADWSHWSRYSGRQRQRIRMGGLIGRATYEGELAPFRPLLALGELIHVGKGTVFGNGQFRIQRGGEAG